MAAEKQLEGLFIERVTALGEDAGVYVIVVVDQRGREYFIGFKTDEALFHMSEMITLAMQRSGRHNPDQPIGQVSVHSDQDEVAVHRIEIQEPADLQDPEPHGLYRMEVKDADGQGVTLMIPHEGVVQWRDRLDALVKGFKRDKMN